MRSARLAYRRPNSSDLGRLHDLDNDPEVMRWINGGLSVSLEDFESELFPVYLESDNGVYGFWIVESEDGFAGWITLRETAPGEASLGYRLARRAWGSGFATEAASFLVSLAFLDKSLVRVTATTYEEKHRFSQGPGKVRVQTDPPVSSGRGAVRYQHAVRRNLGW